MTYYVSSGTLNPTHSVTLLELPVLVRCLGQLSEEVSVLRQKILQLRRTKTEIDAVTKINTIQYNDFNVRSKADK